ncbi:MAG: GRP family sugar transporter [Janthinobacterium lividum]
MNEPVGTPKTGQAGLSLHGMGVICGLAAGVWLGAAEAPTKLVNAGFSPFAISLCMVAGVFTARWTFPTLLKGTSYVFADLRAKKHLIVWAILAGGLWAVANTLTVFAIRDVGLATAFPLWNTNSLIGLLWGRVLFRELQGAGTKNTVKVVLGAVLIVISAIMLGFSTIHGGSTTAPHAVRGLIAAAGASLMWGTMYVPYRKAYLSGMNPLSFVTAFTVGELLTMFALTWTLDGGAHSSVFQLAHSQHLLFWLFLGGFVWVIGDLFQQFAAKYLGIGRGIPLSNTNQLWGLAWGALVFGELATADKSHRMLVVAGSILMILGALAISTAVASAREHLSNNAALERECNRYGLDYLQVLAAQSGDEFGSRNEKRRWWDVAIVLAATGVFVWLGVHAVVPPIAMNLRWLSALAVVLVVALVGAGWALWKNTRFS